VRCQDAGEGGLECACFASSEVERGGGAPLRSRKAIGQAEIATRRGGMVAFGKLLSFLLVLQNASGNG
jgi:hypothetical protein